MRIFLDTNVILDYITNRAAFGEDAEAVVEFCRMDGNEGAFSSLSACDAVYRGNSKPSALAACPSA